MQLGKFHHEDGSSDFAIADHEADGNGLKVVVFAEPGSQYDVHHNVEEGTAAGEFSAT